MKSAVQATTIPFQMAASQPTPLPEKPRRWALGQDFVLSVGHTLNGRYLEVFSTGTGQDVACPHVLGTFLGKDITLNRFYVGQDYDLRGAISKLRIMTGYSQTIKGQGIVIDMPAVARVYA